MVRVRRPYYLRRQRKPIAMKAKKSTSTNGRRRLQPAVAAGAAIAGWTYTKYKNYKGKQQAKQFRKSVKARQDRIEQSDNIINIPSFKVGTPRTLTFDEKVDRISNPPVIFKRQYAWSSECTSGRKGWFGIPINKISSGGVLYGDLYDDAISSQTRITTDTATVDPTLNYTGQASIGKVYIDYMSEKLRMVNSGSNALSITLTLYGYKRDCDSVFTNVNVPMTPINLMMLGSTNNLSLVTPLGYDQTIGNGFEFDTATAGINMTSNYDMPGSSINSGGATCQTDPSLKVLSSHIKDFTGYYFKEVNTQSFSLKPGQQVNHYTIFNDLPDIQRNSQDMYFLKGVAYYLVVSFQAGIVGDSTTANVISTGSGQLSCIIEEKRILGSRGRNKNGKIFMATPPLTGIALANQQIINPDTGVIDTGYEDDS